MNYSDHLHFYGSSRKAAASLGISRSEFNTRLKRENGMCLYGACQELITSGRFCVKHKEHVRVMRRSHHIKNKEYDSIQNKQWENKNRDKRKNRIRDKVKQRLRVYRLRKTNVYFKLADSLRTRLYMAVKKRYKSGSAVRDLGCSIEHLKFYLESKFSVGMTWNNYGRGHGKWCIDHIVPLNSFDLTDREQLLKACNFSNLQPLWWIDNIKKSDTEAA